MLCPLRTPNHLAHRVSPINKNAQHPSLGLKLLSSCVATTHPQSANSNSRPHKSNRPWDLLHRFFSATDFAQAPEARPYLARQGACPPQADEAECREQRPITKIT